MKASSKFQYNFSQTLKGKFSVLGEKKKKKTEVMIAKTILNRKITAGGNTVQKFQVVQQSNHNKNSMILTQNKHVDKLKSN